MAVALKPACGPWLNGSMSCLEVSNCCRKWCVVHADESWDSPTHRGTPHRVDAVVGGVPHRMWVELCALDGQAWIEVAPEDAGGPVLMLDAQGAAALATGLQASVELLEPVRLPRSSEGRTRSALS